MDTKSVFLLSIVFRLIVEIVAVEHVQKSGIQECKESLGTVRRVDYCPSNERSWKEAEFKKGCGNIKQDCVDSKRFLYHCILTDMMNETIEVCAPIRVMFGYCPVYTLIGAKIHHNYARKCQQLFKPCPEDFESNNLHQYPECLELPTGPTLNPDPPASYSERMHFTKRRSTCLLIVLLLKAFTSFRMMI